MKSPLSCTLWLVATTACSSAGGLYHDGAYQQRRSLSASVVRAADGMLSPEAISTLLSTRVQLPERAKLAVVNLGHDSLSGERTYAYHGPIDAQYLQARRALLDAVEEPLLETGRFVEVTHVPRLMVPAEPSLVHLREAAALMQAELLLIYESRSQLITDWNLFFPDEVRSHAVVDVLLMDVKTGAIPYAQSVEAEHLELERGEDAHRFETHKRADRAVSLLAMRAAGSQLAAFVQPE